MYLSRIRKREEEKEREKIGSLYLSRAIEREGGRGNDETEITGEVPNPVHLSDDHLDGYLPVI